MVSFTISEEVYDYMSCHTLDEFIALVDKYPSSLWLTTQTGAVLMNNALDLAKCNPEYTDEDLERFALALCKAFGTVSLEIEGTYCQEKFMTHLDDVLMHHKYDTPCSTCASNSNLCVRLMAAMKKVGFKHAHELDAVILVHEYYASAKFNLDHYLPDFEYPYGLMKQKHAPIAEGLAMYFCKPSRLEEWMINNPDKEMEEFFE